MPVKGTYLAIAGAGAIFLWSGLKGKSISAVLRAIVSGQNPQNVASSTGIASVTGTGNPNATPQQTGNISGGSVSGSAIANDALKYVGHPYLYGGAPGPSGQQPWDCSSFANWVLNHDLKLPVPGYIGGAWDPSTHGPPTGSYLAWSLFSHVPRSQVGAGDLCVWPTHMGIALNNTQMVSALNEQLGTQVTGIEAGGPSGEPLTCGRVGLCQQRESISQSAERVRCWSGLVSRVNRFLPCCVISSPVSRRLLSRLRRESVT